MSATIDPPVQTPGARIPGRSSAEPPALALRGLRMVFGSTVAVDHVDLDVPRGSFFGLVGPNGAGKTTTLSIATGLLRPDAGTAYIDGYDVWGSGPAEAKRRVGILPDGQRLFDRLSGRELLTYTGLLRGMELGVIGSRSAELLEVLDLTGAGATLVVDYSAGMRKKIGLAAALLHSPQLLVLDEPFEAVDPVSAGTIRTILQRYAAAGGTVIFSSRVMELVERLCDQVAIIAQGRVLTAGPIDDVRAGNSLEDRFVALVGGSRDTGEGLSWLGTSSA